ncbi:response regulator [Donghicola sp. XS_ASV15]|uniref:response regulator transcription factor n=1 Tax=Donghicola sp. XS_ASV15 TaxID=3241295 RepID=UPI0035189DF3
MRVLIADDHELLRDTLELYLKQEGNIETRTAEDLSGAVELIESEGNFDLILLDFNMPGMNGLEGLKKVKSMQGGQRVALISGVASRDVAEQALAENAAGFLPKTLSARSVVNAVRFMAMGEQYAPLEFMSQQEEDDKSQHPLTSQLSRREMQVLEGLSGGLSNKEIARNLDVREPTVKLHVKTLYRKIGVHNRTQAALIAKESGLF